MNTTTILQISDLHLGSMVRSIAMNPPRSAEKSCERLADFILSYVKSRRLGKIDLLLLSGDLVEKGALQEFEWFYKGFLLKMCRSGLFERALVVPGNHDVDWNVVRQRQLRQSEGDPLESFHSLFSKAYASWQRGLETYVPRSEALDVASERGILRLGGPAFFHEVVPFNSVELGGTVNPVLKPLLGDIQTKDGKLTVPDATIDPAFVHPEDFERYRQCLPETKTGLRIAVLHHNPLAYESESAKPYRFVNDGAFCSFLLEQNFDVVLHGHQHFSKVFRLGEHGLDGKEAGSKGGFLCIGAPSFGGSENNDQGFNLITLDRKDGESFVTMALERVKFTYDTNTGFKNPSQCSSSHLLPVAPLVDERLAFFDGMFRRLHSAEPLTSIKANPGQAQSEENKEAAFFRSMRRIREELQGIRAIYSLSVFPPARWSEKRLTEFFLPEARRTIMAAGHAAATTGFPANSWALHFHFSTPLHAAIRQALENSRRLRVSMVVRDQLDGGLRCSDRATGYLARALGLASAPHQNREQSLSIWDNVPSIRMNGNGEPDIAPALVEEAWLSMSDSGWTPSNQFQSGALEQLCEFPRIVLWPIETLHDRDEALACIEFHETCGFPLFWLDPSALRTPNGGTRQAMGHFHVFAKSDRSGQELRRARTAVNDTAGAMFAPEDMSNPVQELWNGGIPAGMPSDPTFLDEFVYLLGRKDVLLAADAWALSLFDEGRQLLADLSACQNDPS